MVPAETLRDLYERLGLMADEVGALIGASRQTVLRSAHALGIPVRVGGPSRCRARKRSSCSARCTKTTSSPRCSTRTISRAPARRAGLGPVPRADPAERAAGQGSVLVLRGRAEPHRVAHRATGHDGMGFHAPRGHPAAASGRADPVPAALADRQAAEREITTDLKESPGRANGAAGALEGRPRPGTLVFCCQRGQHLRVAQLGRPGQQVGGLQDAQPGEVRPRHVRAHPQ
jgi:hypothetical protein